MPIGDIVELTRTQHATLDGEAGVQSFPVSTRFIVVEDPNAHQNPLLRHEESGLLINRVIGAGAYRVVVPINPIQPVFQVGDWVVRTGVTPSWAHENEMALGSTGTIVRLNVGFGNRMRIQRDRDNGHSVLEIADFSLIQENIAAEPAPTPVAEPLPADQWQVGDILERVNENFRGLCDIVIGTRVILQELEAEGRVGRIHVGNVATGERYGSHLGQVENYRFVERPSAAVPLQLTRDQWQQWLPGDMLEIRRVQTTGSNRDFGPARQLRVGDTVYYQGGDASRGCYVTVSLEPDGPVCPAELEGAAVRWHSRPATVSSAPRPLLSPQWLPGDILRRVATRDGYENLYPRNCELLLVRRIGNSVMEVCKPDTTGQLLQFRASDLSFVRRPDIVNLPITWPCVVNFEGVSDEDLDLFEAKLQELGMKPHVTFGTRENNAHVRHHQLWLGWDGNGYLYHEGSSATNIGKLLDNWNRILLHVAGKGFKAKTQKKAEKAVPERKLHLSQLPAYAVLVTGDSPQEARKVTFEAIGFTAPAEKYLLLANNTLSGTDNLQVATAFQELHKAVWLDATNDKTLLTYLFTKRKIMLAKFNSKKAAESMRFAVDVNASSPPLITAFKSFLAHIGYRQENTDLNTGPYILLNGGGLLENRTLTWEYASTYNKRRMCFNLAADGQWTKAIERLSKDGTVAIPVENDDELDITPQKGDSVIVVNTAVDKAYPETEAELAYHAAGKTYTITSVTGTSALLAETGMRLHLDRLAVATKAANINSGDVVVMTTAVGELLPVGKCLTYLDVAGKAMGQLVDEKGSSFDVTPENYKLASDEQTLSYLLALNNVTMPLTVRITNPDSVIPAGEEIVLSDVWLLNSRRLGFWVDQGTDRSAYYQLADFEVVTTDTQADTLIKVYKNSDDVFIGKKKFSRKKLEQLLATAY